MHETKALILMGGTGARFGSETPKQFHRLAGKKVYLHTLETFLAAKAFDEILLVCPPAWIEEIKKDLLAYPSAPVTVISGGSSRQASSLCGLLACGEQTKTVVIHDAVRPFLSLEILKANIAAAEKYSAVDTCIPSADTLVHSPEGKEITAIPCRAHYLRGQTPQSFAYPLILKAHLKAKEEGITESSDDCSLVIRFGHPVHIVMGSEENIKITSELDLFLAEQLLRLRTIPILHEQNTLLAGKHFVITGGTGGIGRILCEYLEKEGAIPIPLSRSSPDYSADLTSFTETKKAFEAIAKDYGPIDGLINSVGLLSTKPLTEHTSQEIDLLLASNLSSVIYSCKCAHLKPGAHILNIASSSYTRGRKDQILYASAKAAVVNFTQGLAEERPDLCINVITPNRTSTPMRETHFPGEDPATLLQPAEIAAEILGALKSTVTGTVIEIRKK